MALKAGRKGLNKNWVDSLGEFIVSKLPLATPSTPGLVKVPGQGGLYVNTSGGLYIYSTTLNMVAPQFATTKTYSIGDLVIYNSQLYKAVVDIETPGNWKPANWTLTSVVDEFIRKED